MGTRSTLGSFACVSLHVHHFTQPNSLSYHSTHNSSNPFPLNLFLFPGEILSLSLERTENGKNPRAPTTGQHGTEAQLRRIRRLPPRQRLRPSFRRRRRGLSPPRLSPRHQLLRHLPVPPLNSFYSCFFNFPLGCVWQLAYLSFPPRTSFLYAEVFLEF